MTNTETAAARAARTMTTSDLTHVAKTLNAELEADMNAGVRMTQAHLGKIELACACTDEIVRRGHEPRPPQFVDVSYIDGCKLSNAIRCF